MARINRNKENILVKIPKSKNAKLTYTHTCVWCEEKFISARKTAFYCSNACKQKAYYYR